MSKKKYGVALVRRRSKATTVLPLSRNRLVADGYRARRFLSKSTEAYQIPEYGKYVAQTGRSNGKPVIRDPNSQPYAKFGEDFAAILKYLCQKGCSIE